MNRNWVKWLSSWKLIILLAACSLVAGGVYLGVSWRVYRIGFPLDDAWIHQTYARSLAFTGQWDYFPGKPSAGSTSPLWSALLAVGYWLKAAPYTWTYFWGLISLTGIGYLGELIFRKYANYPNKRFPWVGIFLVLEWHLVWSAFSGMETLLYCLFLLLFFMFISQDNVDWLGAGFVIGISIWLRPDGVTLLGPAIFCLVLNRSSVKDKLKGILLVLLGFAVPLSLYFLFQFWVGGSWMPNTFFAKQAEYRELLAAPIINRFFSLASLPLVGAGVLLLPGFCYCLCKFTKARRWAALSAGIWWLGYIAMYAIRLPVTYQHGRYLIPAMPVFFILGCVGVVDLVHKLLRRGYILRLLGRTWLISTGVVMLAFFVIGASSYATDVAIIETEMVQTADWLRLNIPPGEVVAAHDIGALGYFGEHELIDLAGLISPDVIPIIRDENRIADYLDQKGVKYLVTFPGWYPDLVRQSELLYQTESKFAPEAGGENMAVYLWKAQTKDEPSK